MLTKSDTAYGSRYSAMARRYLAPPKPPLRGTPAIKKLSEGDDEEEGKEKRIIRRNPEPKFSVESLLKYPNTFFPGAVTPELRGSAFPPDKKESSIPPFYTIRNYPERSASPSSYAGAYTGGKNLPPYLGYIPPKAPPSPVGTDSPPSYLGLLPPKASFYPYSKEELSSRQSSLKDQAKDQTGGIKYAQEGDALVVYAESFPSYSTKSPLPYKPGGYDFEEIANKNAKEGEVGYVWGLKNFKVVGQEGSEHREAPLGYQIGARSWENEVNGVTGMPPIVSGYYWNNYTKSYYPIDLSAVGKGGRYRTYGYGTSGAYGTSGGSGGSGGSSGASSVKSYTTETTTPVNWAGTVTGNPFNDLLNAMIPFMSETDQVQTMQYLYTSDPKRYARYKNASGVVNISAKEPSERERRWMTSSERARILGETVQRAMKAGMKDTAVSRAVLNVAELMRIYGGREGEMTNEDRRKIEAVLSNYPGDNQTVEMIRFFVRKLLEPAYPFGGINPKTKEGYPAPNTALL